MPNSRVGILVTHFGQAKLRVARRRQAPYGRAASRPAVSPVGLAHQNVLLNIGVRRL